MFDYPPKRTTTSRRVRNQSSQLRDERRKPELPGPYIYVGDFVAEDDPGNDPPVTTWQSPEWQNSFTWFEDHYVGFRHGLDGFTEFIGILDLTQGASTGNVAFTLPVPFRAITFHFTFPVFVEGTEWWAGILEIDKTTGDVTVYWPIEATPI